MHSRILTSLALDPLRLERDVAAILRFPDSDEEYSEYRFGRFMTYVLRSPTGRTERTQFEGLRGAARPTELGRRLEYLQELVDATWNTERLVMMRIYLQSDALLIPHRDYLEFQGEGERMVRLHLPLRTNPRALHSEDDVVFHMRRGEVWHLDVLRVHAACNASPEPRLSLVLDFRATRGEIPSLFLPSVPLRETPPEVVSRPPLPPRLRAGLAGLGPVATSSTLKDLVQLLSRLHFHYDVPAAEVFVWLQQICLAADDRSLADKAERLRRYLIERRESGERFAL